MFYVTINEGTAEIKNTYRTKTQFKILVRCNKNVVDYLIENVLTIPLTFGNGTYVFMLCERTKGTNYAVRKTITKTIKFKNEKAYEVMPNSYVSYSMKSSFYAIAKELKTWDNIQDYIINNFVYDYIGAILMAKKSLTPPDLEKCFKQKKGICYDLSALAVAMARICGIPASLVMGTANKSAHAWVEINGELYDITKMLQHNHKTYAYVGDRKY